MNEKFSSEGVKREKSEFDKATENMTVDDLALVPIESESVLAPEDIEKFGSFEEKELAKSLEKLDSNLEKIDAMPQTVVESPEGTEISKNYAGKIGDSIKSFFVGAREKLAGINDENLVKYLGTGAVLAVVGPALLQFARAKWPEVGVVLDASPSYIQSIANLDIAWGMVLGAENTDVLNLMSDIASGRIDFSALSPEQLEILNSSVPDLMDTANETERNKSFFEAAGVLSTAQEIINNDVVGVNAARGLGNIAGVASSAVFLGMTLSKVGKLARGKK